MLKIAFIHDWNLPLNEFLDNQDGLPRAIEVLSETNKIVYYLRGERLTHTHRNHILEIVPSEAILLELVEAQKPDVIVCWGSLDRPWFRAIHERLRTPKVPLFAGGPRNHIARSYFNVIVCESQCYIDDFTKVGVTAVRGFGTNTKVFTYRGLPKVWDAIYPASLCFHKNIELFSQTFLSHGLCVGNHNEPTIVSKVLTLGTSLLNRVGSNVLCDLYNMSRVTVITAGPEGGAQRVVLESMACGIPVIVMNDHDRCREFVEESGFGRVCHPIATDIQDAYNDLIANIPDKSIGMAYIKNKWTEYHYADSILNACNKAMAA